MSERPRRVGRYSLLSRLGVSRTTEVWRAGDGGGRGLVLKLHAAGAGEDEARRELRWLGVSHPGLATCFDAGRLPDGRLYTVTEFIAGRPLDETAFGAAELAPGAARRLAGRLLAALAVAHEQGLVHRDIKSTNVLVETAGGRPVLIDFGLACPLAGASGEVLAGTPRAMAPELFHGGAASIASDLWATGLVLAEALLGEPLFLGRDPGEMAEERAAFPGLSAADAARLDDPALARLLTRLLDPDPQRRPESAAAALAALDLPPAERDAIAREDLDCRRVAALMAHHPRPAAQRAALTDGALWLDPFVDGSTPVAVALAHVLALAAAVPDGPAALTSAVSAARATRDPAPSHLAALVVALGRVHGVVLWLDETGADAELRRDRAELRRELAEAEGVTVLGPAAPGAAAQDVLRAWLGPSDALRQRLDAAPPATWGDLDAATAQLLRAGAVSVDDRGLGWDEARLPTSWPSPAGDDGRAGLPSRAVAVLDVLALSTRPLGEDVLVRLLGPDAPAACAHLLAAGLVMRRRAEPADHFVLRDGALRRSLAAGMDVAAEVRASLALALADELAPPRDAEPVDALGAEEVLADAVSMALVGPGVDDDAPAAQRPDPTALTDLVRRCAETLRRVGRLAPAAALLARGVRGAGPGAPLLRLHADRLDVLVRRLDFVRARVALDEARAALGSLPALAVREGRILALTGRRADAVAIFSSLDLSAMDVEDAVLLLQFRGEVHYALGQIEPASLDFREALRRHGDRADRRVMVLLERLGLCAQERGDVDQAVRHFEESLALAESLGQQLIAGTLLANIGRALRARGETRRGLQLQEEGVRRHELAGATTNLVVGLNSLGVGWLTVGRLDVARRHLARAQRLAREMSDGVRLAQVLNNVGLVLAAEGRFDAADEAWAESLALRTEHRDAVGRAAVLAYRGRSRLARGDVASARADLAAARACLVQVPSPHWESELALLECDLFLAEGRPDDAAAAARRVHEGAEARARVVALDRLARATGEGLEDVDPAAFERSPALADLLATRAALRFAAGRTADAESDLEASLAVLSECPDGLVEARVLCERVHQDAARLARVLATEPLDPTLTGTLASRVERDLAQARALVQLHDARPLARRLDEAAERLADLRRDRDMGSLAALAERLRNVERLIEINKRVNAERDGQKLLDLIIDSAIELTGAARGFLILFDGRAEEFRAARNIDEGTIRDPQFVVSHSVARNVVREGRPLLTANAIDDDRLASAASISELKLLSILCVPLVHRGRTLGAVYLDHPQVVGRFHAGHLETVTSLAELAAIALENARLAEGLQRTNAELRHSQDEITRLNEALRRKLDEREEELEETRESLDASRRALALRYDYSAIVTRSPLMHEVLDLMDRVTDTHFPVLIRGESGTGKELIARALHFNGPRKDRNFLSINCAAIAEPLIESELFGSMRGAFTGADRDRKGLFAQAHEGTLFLDEIGDMSLTVQKRLLRVLQEGEFLPVGGREVQRVDVRILCATHRDLSEMVAAGSFREDLYYRLVVARIDLPPLRERPEDIALLLPHFLEQHGGRSAPRLDPEALQLLEGQPWPGNVRELENFAMNLLLFDPGGGRLDADLVRRILGRRGAAAPDPGEAPPAGDGTHSSLPLKERLAAFERDQVRAALLRCGGNKAQAARDLGISVRTLYKILERLGLG